MPSTLFRPPHQALHHAGNPHGGDIEHRADGGNPEVDGDRLGAEHLGLAEQPAGQEVVGEPMAMKATQPRAPECT